MGGGELKGGDEQIQKKAQKSKDNNKKIQKRKQRRKIRGKNSKQKGKKIRVLQSLQIPPESQPKITLQNPNPFFTADKNLSLAMYFPLRIPSKSTPATFTTPDLLFLTSSSISSSFCLSKVVLNDQYIMIIWCK